METLPTLIETYCAWLLARLPQVWTPRRSLLWSASLEGAFQLFVDAGLIERRVGMFFATAGKPRLYAEIEFSGPAGLAEAIDPVTAEILCRYSGHLAELARQGIPRRVVVIPGELDDFRATRHGQVAIRDAHAKRGNLPIDFLLRRGFFKGRPDVESHGRLLHQSWEDGPAGGGQRRTDEPAPTATASAVGPSQAAGSSDSAAATAAGMPGDQSASVLKEILRQVSEINAKMPTSGHTDAAAEEPAEPESLPHPAPLGKSEQIVLAAMAAADPGLLLSLKEIRLLIADKGQRRSVSVIGSAVNELIDQLLAERPTGKHKGTRLTIKGRRLFRKISS